MFDGVIDVSHYQGPNIDFAAAAASGIAAVIHKATQGTSVVDPMLATNRTKAQAANLRFGSYHFGTAEDGGAQAEFYLRTVGPNPGELLALDFESSTAGPSMTLEEARAFVSLVQSRTGKWPVLYAGHYLKDLLAGQADPLLSQCPLWLAQYGPSAVLPAGWGRWTLWQWTDGTIGAPQPVPGVGHCDRDRYIGTAEDLGAFWDSVSAEPARTA